MNRKHHIVMERSNRTIHIYRTTESLQQEDVLLQSDQRQTMPTINNRFERFVIQKKRSDYKKKHHKRTFFPFRPSIYNCDNCNARNSNTRLETFRLPLVRIDRSCINDSMNGSRQKRKIFKGVASANCQIDGTDE